MKVLITAAATAQAYQLERLVGEGNIVCLADSADFPAIMLQSRTFIRIPEGSASSFAHELLTACLDNGIERVFPLRKEEILALAEVKTLFSEYGIEVMVPSPEILSGLEFRSKPGKLVPKLPGVPNEQLPSNIDCGVFLSDAPSSNNFSIFSAS